MKTSPAIFLILTFVFLASCKNTTLVQSDDLGTFRGNVALVSAIGDTLPDYTGAMAHIEGTEFSATTSASGDWQIDNVPAGIYNIVITKPGFDTLVIPQYQFSGAGTSFVVSTAIQALPMDSLVFTLKNEIQEYYNPDHTSYLALMSFDGAVAGPDSLQQSSIFLSLDSSFISCYLINNRLSSAGRGYSTPPYTSGTVVTAKSYLYAMPAHRTYKYFQQAMSPYVVTRTVTLP